MLPPGGSKIIAWNDRLFMVSSYINVLMRYYIMKRRFLEPELPDASAEESLCRALLAMKDGKEMQALLHDLCTPAELEALVDRWRVVPYLLDGMSYRGIHERTAVSITTIGRVARFLNQGSGGYLAAAARAAQPKARPAVRGDAMLERRMPT